MPGERLEHDFTTLERLVHHLEAMRVADYVELLEKPTRLIFINFIAGLSRGLGIAIGASLIFALLLQVLHRLLILNLPVIGNFIADIVRIVEMRHGQY